MDTNYTAMALVVDRSGSMHSMAADVKGSVKQLIGDQKKNEGKATLTVSQFDHTYEVIHNHKNIQEVDEDQFNKAYTPRGSTALLDAIGRATLDMQQEIDKMAVEDRPQRVIVAVITDGYENASTEFNIDQIKEMIKSKEAQGWDFMFMGASLDTIDIAKSMGFSANKSAFYDATNIKGCMGAINEKVTQARLNKEVNITEEERANMAAAAA